MMLLVLGIDGVAAVLVPAVWMPLVFIAWSIAGVGIGLAYTMISLVVLETAPAGHEGDASASMSLAGALGVAQERGLDSVLLGAAGPGTGAAGSHLYAFAKLYQERS